MIEKDGAQPGVDSQPLPAGKSKNLRPRARPLNRAKTQAQVISSSPPQPQGQTQPPASGAPTVGVVESPHASPRTQGVENEDSEKDTPRLSHKRPSTLHQRNHADKRQKISDQIQSKVPETMDRSADVNAAAEGNYILIAFFQRLANKTLASTAESPLLDNTDMGGQSNKGLPVVQSPANVPKKSRPIRAKKATAPTRIQPKRSSRS
jgi:hypothetical protein